MILGHEKEEAVLVRSLISNRVFPTWIFYGPWGVGKASIALKFAKCLLSETIPGGDTLDIDPSDSTNKLVDTRTHPDFFMLEQSSESISIEETRNLMLKVRKSPSLSKWRVIILENSSDLNRNIQNSLLKILEEPPKNTVFIMICNNIGIIPKTVLSRAAKIYFHPLEESLVKQILDEKHIKDSAKLAQLSEGSVGYAIYLSENNGIEVYKNILTGFFHDGSQYPKAAKYVIENNVGFEMIKASFFRIFRIYTEILIDMIDPNCSEEAEILKPVADGRKHMADREIKRIQEIISMICRCEPMMLDKNAVIVDTFERFFS